MKDGREACPLLLPVAIAQMKDPKARAFMERLYEEYHRLMYARAYRVTGEFQALDDIIQDSLEGLMGKTQILTQLPRHKLVAYIVNTVGNTAHSYIAARIRRRAHVIDISDEALHNLPSGEAADDALLHRAQIDEVRSALGRLSERDAKLMRMKYSEGLDDQVIAEAMGITPGGVRQALLRARRRLFEMMREEGGQDE